MHRYAGSHFIVKLKQREKIFNKLKQTCRDEATALPLVLEGVNNLCMAVNFIDLFLV